MAQFVQPSFAAGEVSTEIQGRVDIAKYQVGLKTAENFLIKVQGGAMNRPGLEHIAPRKYAPSHADTKARNIPFSYNTEQTYNLIFGHEYMWVLKDGGVVLESAFSKSISSITLGTDTIGCTANTLSDGEWIFINEIVGTVELNNRFFKVSGAATDSITLSDQHDNVIDLADLTPYVSGGTIYRVYELSTPYQAEDLGTLRYMQSANEMTFAHKNYDPYVLTRTDHDNWTLAVEDFVPSLDAPANVSATATVLSGGATDYTYRYVVASVSDETGEVSYPSASDSCTNNLGNARNINTITWDAVTGADRYYIYMEKGGLYGFIGQSLTTSFIDDNIEPDSTDRTQDARTPFDGSGNKPRSVIYHDQRKVFGGTSNKPNTIEGSQIGRFSNMNTSTPLKADDSYSFGLVSKEVQEVRDMLSMRDLIVFTSGGVWKVSGGDGGAIEPTSINAEQQTEDGISIYVPPIVVGNRALYWSDFGKNLSDIGYDFGSDGYIGDDLTVLCRHLFKHTTIIESAWHREPYRCAWHLREDGVLLSQTYHKQHEVNAFARHITDGYFKSISTVREDDETALYALVDREIDGVQTGYIERLHTRTFRDIDECFFVDCGTTRNNWNTTAANLMTLTGGTPISDDDPNWSAGVEINMTATGHAPFVAGDVGREIVLRVKDVNGVTSERCRFEVTAYGSATVIYVEPLQAVPESMQNTGIYEWGFASDVVDGLWHLEGRTIIALADGDVEGDADELVVTGGMVTLQTPAVHVHAGLPYTATLATLRMNVNLQDGTTFTKLKSIPYVDILVEETRHVEVATNLTPDRDTGEVKTSLYFQRGADDEEWGEPTDLLNNEVIRVTMPADWNEGQVAILQTLPLPISILAIAPEVEFGG